MFSDTLGSVVSAVIALASPKTRNFGGRHQYCIIYDLGTIEWLRWYIGHQPPRRKLWPFSKDRFLKVFINLLSVLGIDKSGYTVGSLRPGGATHLILEGCEMSRVKFLGRWRSEASMSSYIQEATACLAWSQLPVHVRAQLVIDVRFTQPLWDHCPALPSKHFFAWRRLPLLFPRPLGSTFGASSSHRSLNWPSSTRLSRAKPLRRS
jgi:hypothetical protein